MNNFSNIFSINLLSRIAIKNFASSMVQSYYATTCINRILTNAAIETIENLMIKEKNIKESMTMLLKNLSANLYHLPQDIVAAAVSFTYQIYQDIHELFKNLNATQWITIRIILYPVFCIIFSFCLGSYAAYAAKYKRRLFKSDNSTHFIDSEYFPT